MKNFFISYNKADRSWAEWIAWQLEEAGYTTVIQAWDFLPGSNFVMKMQQASSDAERTIAVLSPDYLNALYINPEWAAAFAQDPTGKDGKLVPVRIKDCDLQGMLSPIIYVDLVGLEEAEAKNTLVNGISRSRVKPKNRPTFPRAERPPFPGALQLTGTIDIHESDRPYKFLDYYETSDADAFWGREKDISEVAERVKSQPFLVLYGISGVGKTSLLLAGVIPHIEKYGSWCIYARCEDDPEWSIKRKVLKKWSANLPTLQPFFGESLPQFFAQAYSYLKKQMVVFLDQFEEFFLRLSLAERNAFGKTLALWSTFDPPPFQLVLAIREDYLGKVDELKEYLKNPLASTHRLTNLTKQNARLAISKPADRVGITYSEGMVDQLIDELASQSKTESGIFPPHLQIVCSRLAESVDQTSRTITWIDVQKHGGVTGLLDKYIDQALFTLPQDQQELAWDILKRATTAARTKFILKADEICHAEGSRELLAKLVERRLIRKIAEKEEELYELAHDKLAETLNQRMSEAEKTARDVLDMVRLEYTNWQQHNVPMDEKKIRLLKKHRYNPHLRLPQELEEFIRLSERLNKVATRKQRIYWIMISFVVVVLLAIVYYYYPRWTTPKPNLERIRVEAGWFEMGSRADSPFSRPRHAVYVESFEISKFEVTNEQYAAFVRAMRWDPPKSEYFSNSKYANHPVVGVNWREALAFSKWMGGRLPTEAEWEKAATWDAKANRKLVWPWGDEWNPQKIVSVEGGLRDTASVYRLPEGRSPYGVMHMVGNVAEWTSSIYKPYPYNPKDGRESIDEIAPRVIRGGSWSLVDVAALPTNRTELHPSTRDRDLGFRVAWSVEMSYIPPKKE